MSHSVFRDLDDDKSSGNGSKGDVADNNLIVFIDKDDDVRVDPNALQDFIVNANTDTKSTVSVIRVGSPTPSMEMEIDDNDEENSTKSSDAENDNHIDSDGGGGSSSSKTDSESNEEESDDDDDDDSSKHQKSKKRKKKSRNKVRSFGLTVENFYNPQQAVDFATEIMSKDDTETNIAGITDPKQLKADYEHLRYIIANDHCYTPYTYADSPNEEKPKELADGAKRDPKNNKSKLLTSTNNSTSTTTSTVQSITGKKNARNSILSKSHPANGLDRDTSNSTRNRSVDDANSSTENTGERSSDDEEAESDDDFSDMTPSESDNDRDSDLDFSVNDCHSRRAKKISKRKIRAKKLAAKKRRRSTVEFTGSDDGSTPNRKKSTKLPKKSLNTSSKSSTNQTPTTTISTTTKSTPVVTTVSGTIKTPTAISTITKSSVNTPAVKSLPVTSTPRITKVTYLKPSTQNPTKLIGIQKANSTISSATTVTAALISSSAAAAAAATTTATLATATRVTPTASAVRTVPASTPEHKTRIIIMKHKDRKPQLEHISLSGVSTLFAPDVVKKPSNAPSFSGVGIKNSMSSVQSPTVMKVVQSSTSKTLTPITVHAITTTHSLSGQQTNLTKVMKTPVNTYPRRAPKSTVNLASEQDKQLDLIDSLVQEELSRTKNDAATAASQSNASDKIVPAAIPNIVKMLETSDASTPMQTIELSTHQPTSMSNNSVSYTTTSSVTDSHMLPDDLLEPFDLPDELMQHVAKLVEDKNVQEIIDQSIGSMSSCAPPIQPTPIQTVATESKPNEPIQNASSTLKMEVDEPKTPVNMAKSTPNTPATAGKEGIKVKRSDGSFITLPPPEAPTTRGAKRRAETTPDVQQPKQKVFTVIVQTESPQNATPPNIKSHAPANTPKAKPIGGRERRASVAVKRASIESKPRRSMSISNPPPPDGGGGGGGGDGNEDDDEEEDGSDGSYNSEDDPHRLWCICRTPHNNRFMICCDKCEEWFHGKCVGITRQMGREMEHRQSEWICPNCEKKLQPSIKNIFPRKLPTGSPSIKIKEASNPSMQSKSDSTVPNCIVCGIKVQSRGTSVYCSDDCIRKHASTTKAVVGSVSNTNESDSTATTTTAPSLKSPTSEHGERKTIQPKIISQLFKDKANHVVVVDKSTGKYLTGKSAPTADNLKQWLAEHPNHEVLKPGTPQAEAFKAKQQQLKSLAKNMDAERELFAVTQPAKIQTKLRFEADKMVYVNPTTQKPVTTTSTSLKRSISATSASSPVHTKSPVSKTESVAAKTPKLTSTPAQKTSSVHKKRSSDGKTSTSTSTSTSASTSTSTSTPTQRKSESSSSSSSNDRERLRVSARKSLIEQLIARTKEIADSHTPRLTEAEISEFIVAAEQEMFDMFGGDTNHKYKAKYRSLVYNIKDRKNLTLFEKISKKLIKPKQLVRMSTEELASQELAEWRNNENKHQLEMITKSELDMLASGNTYVLKTHKGEEVIQESAERISLDRSLPVEDLVSALNSPAVSSSDAAVTKDSRFGKHSSSDGKSSSLHSSKRDGNRSHDKKSDRHESRSGGSSSSKHKRKRSRERHSSHSHGSSGHSHSHKDRDKDKKERSSGSDSRRDKDKDRKEHKSNSSSSNSNSRSKTHTDKDRHKREASNNSNSSNSNSSGSNNKSTSTPKAQKIEEISIIDKILKAESTINSILHPESSNAGPMNVSSGSLHESTAATAAAAAAASTASLTRQPSAANESDQEPTSTVTSPPEATPEFHSATPPPIEKSLNSVVWSGNINMVDVATFKVSLSVLSGSTAMIEFPKEFDVVGRISPDTVWDYLEKIRQSKDIVLLRFSPLSISDDETAYSTFLTYLDSRQRLGVIKIPSKLVKDFYILPLTSHKSLPSILKSTTGFDLGANRPDLLLGIIVRNRMTPTASVHIPPPKYRQPNIPFIGISHKPVVNIPVREEHYTPPSSPNINHASAVSASQVIKSFTSNLDDDEPYSPGGSDEDDLTLNTIPTTYMAAANTVNPITDYAKPLGSAHQQMEELNRQIEAEKKQIAMHLGTVDIDEPYSPTSSVSPPINPNLSNISIPANLADILKNVASFGSTANQMPMNQYSNLMDTSDNEYVPVPSASTSMSYAPAPTQLMPPPSMIAPASQPSKLAQLTDEELLRLVPDEID